MVHVTVHVPLAFLQAPLRKASKQLSQPSSSVQRAELSPPRPSHYLTRYSTRSAPRAYDSLTAVTHSDTQTH